MKAARCGWCITGSCEHCVTVLEFSIDGSKTPKPRKPPFYLWRCGCSCLYAQNTKCLDCQRRGVVVDRTSRCVDKTGCRKTEARRRPSPLYNKDYA